MKTFIFNLSVKHPILVLSVVGLLTLVFLLQFPNIKIDTDPENMLSQDEPVRKVHHDMKTTFQLHDMLVVGIFKEEGVFTKETISRVVKITEEIKELEGIIVDDIISVSEVDDISNEDGTIRVSPLVDELPESDAEAEYVRDRILLNPILKNKLAAIDGKLVGIYIPIEEKNMSYRLSREIEEIAKTHLVDEEYYIAGLPIAEDTFGVEMFNQMGMVAPLAGLVIFLVMLFFFKRAKLNIAPMLLSVVTIIWTMGLLIGMGFTVHIMSSMIPIFLFPIAVLNSIHIISDFLERYKQDKNVSKALVHTLDDLFAPMLFTSLTTFVGFISLTLTPIPPVQVFGFFVSFGIATAWLLSMTFLPAYISLLPERSLNQFKKNETFGLRIITASSKVVKKFSLEWSKPILGATIVVLIISAVGINKIVVNDNPVNWFKPQHPLRQADEIMNQHMGGTYMSNLIFSGDNDVFKSSEVVQYVEKVQQFMDAQPGVGATSSVADILKKISLELKGTGTLPSSEDEIAQFYFIYELAGGDPDDLFTFITSDYSEAHIWVQMNKGDNILMKSFVDNVNAFIEINPMPEGLTIEWAGLNYINVVWQEKMVLGMLDSLLGGFIGVFIMMAILFRSFIWAVLSMIPLSATITFIYAIVGFTGKPYDMPIAVLSSLTLGLSIDFAIHFIKRSQNIHEKTGNFLKTMELTFGEPAKAITLNMIIIAIGFTPLFASNLLPYVTVGIFFFLIMIASGIGTLIILPALSQVFNKKLFPQNGNISKKGKHSMKLSTSTLTAFIALVSGSAFFFNADSVQSQTALEIMKSSHLAFYYAGDDGSTEVTMTLTDKRGKERIRKFTMLRKDFEEGGEQRYYTYFIEPNDVKRMTFMVWKYQEKDDDRWIYIPSLDLVKRIAAKDRNSSFVGSDFSYEDVSGRHWMEDEHSIVKEEVYNESAVYVIKSVPRDPKSSEFNHKISYIDKTNLLPLKEEYFDNKDELVRIFTAENIQDVNGILIPATRTMENLKKNHKTVVEFTNIKINIGIEDDIFSERYLRKPPSKYIK